MRNGEGAFCCFVQFVYFRSPIKGKVGEWLKPPVC